MPKSSRVWAAFFLSGVAGLIHEVVWSKLLVGVIGATAHAQAIVLAVFMGGLAVGSAVFGRRVDRRGRPLTTYVVLEVLIAAYCLLLPLFLKVSSFAYTTLATQFHEAVALRLVLRLLLAAVVVLFPAILMGATLPVLARHLIGGADDTRRQVARLYGLNSLGAVVGAGIAGFLTLPLMGIYPSLALASGLNLAAASLLWRQSIYERRTSPSLPAVTAGQERTPELRSPGSYGAIQYVVALVALALSGFAAMGYEVLFVRVISLSFGLSVYSFTIMLMCFITGISLGSLIISRVRVERPLWILGVSQLAVVVALLAVTPLVSRLPYLIGLLRISLHGASMGFELYQFAKAGLCLAILLIPTMCLGIGFPLVAQIQARRSPRLGTHVGSTYSWNTIGNVLGTVLTSLVLLPGLGLLWAFHFNFALNLIAGLAILLVLPSVTVRRRLAVWTVASAAVVIYLIAGTAWLEPMNLARNHLRMNSRPTTADDSHPSSSFEAWKTAFVANEDDASHFFFEEDAHATVLAVGDGRQIILHVNGKADASTDRDLPTQMFLAHFAIMLNPEARSLLVIGHGSGITAGSAMRHPIERADIVEISRGVLNADTLFAPVNYHVLDDPRVRVYEEDGQSFLRTTPRKYDLIISEPSNPWIAGISGLFTVEYFEAVRDGLNDGGLATIWFHDYEQTTEAVELVLRTLRSVFGHVELFRSHDFLEMIAVAGVDVIEPDFAAMERWFDEPAIRNDFARIGICNLGGVLMHHSISDARLQELIPPGPLNTVGRQRLEYAAPRNFFNDVGANYLKRHDALYQRQELGPDTLLARYIAYRTDVGEPVSRAELQDVADSAEFLGFSSRKIVPALMALAQGAPLRTAPATRPARGGVADPATMGLYEANYWQQRRTKEGNPDAARPFAQRVEELVRALEK